MDLPLPSLQTLAREIEPLLQRSPHGLLIADNNSECVSVEFSECSEYALNPLAVVPLRYLEVSVLLRQL